jgi:Protein of Unknown function (DUF2784)
MLYQWLADLVMVLHGALLVFFVVGGFLAWQWFVVMWFHLGVAVWNLTIVLLDFGCPVTATEKALRQRGGEEVYSGGYISHYLDGPVWPEGYTWVAELAGFALLLVSYAGLVVIRLRRRRRAATERATEAAA